MKQILKKYRLYLLTFLASSIVISIIFILNDVTPYGEKSLLCVDFFHQYGPMLGELYDRIHSGQNLLYSFSMGLGLPFFRNFLNYMSSPFNIIILFFTKSSLLTSYSFIIGLKAVFSSLTLVYFLSHKFKTKDLRLIPLGILYAFSSYYAAYYWNIMWMDGMVFLPLIALGIEYIVDSHKWKFYTIWLAVMLIANYFIGFMICIFSILYFIIYSFYKLDIKKEKRKESIKYIIKGALIFIGASLLAGMIASVFLVPLYYAINSISATGDAWPSSQYYQFTVEDFLKYHFSGVPITVFSSDPINAPNISTGILSIGLFLLFIFNKKISLKTKICYLLLLAFFILAFFWAPLDYILHAFHVPNDLPYRYSFIYSFVFIIIDAYAILNIQKNSIKTVIITYVSILIILLLMLTSNWQGLNNDMILLNITFLTLYFIIYIVIYFKKKIKTILLLLLIIVSGIEVTISINHNWDISHIMKDFYNDYDETKEILDYVDSLPNDKFYRIENTNFLTFNDPSWYGYYGMTTFSSMAYEKMAILEHKLGIPGNNINSYYYVQSTPIFDLMFDINYFIGFLNDSKRYNNLKTFNNDVNLFIYNVGLGFGVYDNLKTWNFFDSDPFRIQNDFIYKASGVSNVLEKLEPINAVEIFNDDVERIVTYSFPNKGDNMYFYTSDLDINYFVIGDTLYYLNDLYASGNEINDMLSYSSNSTYIEPSIINISSSEELMQITVSFNMYDKNVDNANSLYFYTINHNKFLEAYNFLKTNKLNITEFNEDEIKAMIELTDDMIVYTSIPYDEGWHVYVDDKKTETYKIGDALLAFNASKGSHTVRFEFVPKGLFSGLILTLTGLMIIIGSTAFDFYKKKTK